MQVIHIPMQTRSRDANAELTSPQAPQTPAAPTVTEEHPPPPVPPPEPEVITLEEVVILCINSSLYFIQCQNLNISYI